jgi:hypothetical protein
LHGFILFGFELPTTEQAIELGATARGVACSAHNGKLTVGQNKHRLSMRAQDLGHASDVLPAGGGHLFFSINIPDGYTHFRERPNAETALPSQATSADHKIRPMREHR